MAEPFPLQTSFTGMVRDKARDGLPSGALWNCVDYFPEYLDAPLRKRGGWTYASPSFGGTYIDAIAYAPFATGEKNIAIGQDGNAYTFTLGAATSLGAAFPVKQNPVFHRTGVKGLVIIPAGDGVTAPKSYRDDGVYGALAASAPSGKYADVWKDRTLLASGTQGGVLYPNRVWFSPIGDPAAVWDTTLGYVDAQFPVVGICALSNTILMFHARSTERIRGSIPPSAADDSDIVQDQVFSVGCIDARSIVKYNETALWADARGVYQSDGAALKDLTKTGGMLGYWRTMLSAYSSGYTVAAGVYNDTYIVSVMNGSTFLDCLVYDMGGAYWYRLGNFPARAFTRQGSTFEESYMALGNAGRVASLSSIVSPSAANKLDANGTPIQPYLETAVFRGFMHIRRRWIPSLALQDWRNVYLDYDLRDADHDAPVMRASYANNSSATVYTPIDDLFPPTLESTRARRPLNFNGSAFILKVEQVGPSADTRFNGIEAEYEPRDTGKLKQ